MCRENDSGTREHETESGERKTKVKRWAARVIRPVGESIENGSNLENVDLLREQREENGLELFEESEFGRRRRRKESESEAGVVGSVAILSRVRSMSNDLAMCRGQNSPAARTQNQR